MIENCPVQFHDSVNDLSDQQGAVAACEAEVSTRMNVSA